MKYAVLAIRDEVMESYRNPMLSENIEAAKRSLRVAMSTPEPLDLKDSPSDYSLWLIAHWSSDTALYTPVVPPQLVARVRDFVPQPKGE